MRARTIHELVMLNDPKRVAHLLRHAPALATKRDQSGRLPEDYALDDTMLRVLRSAPNGPPGKERLPRLNYEEVPGQEGEEEEEEEEEGSRDGVVPSAATLPLPAGAKEGGGEDPNLLSSMFPDLSRSTLASVLAQHGNSTEKAAGFLLDTLEEAPSDLPPSRARSTHLALQSEQEFPSLGGFEKPSVRNLALLGARPAPVPGQDPLEPHLVEQAEWLSDGGEEDGAWVDVEAEAEAEAGQGQGQGQANDGKGSGGALDLDFEDNVSFAGSASSSAVLVEDREDWDVVSSTSHLSVCPAQQAAALEAEEDLEGRGITFAEALRANLPPNHVPVKPSRTALLPPSTFIPMGPLPSRASGNRDGDEDEASLQEASPKDLDRPIGKATKSRHGKAQYKPPKKRVTKTFK